MRLIILRIWSVLLFQIIAKEIKLFFLWMIITFFGQTQVLQKYPLLLLLHFHSIIGCRIYIALIDLFYWYHLARRHFRSWGSHSLSRASLWGIFSFLKTYPLFAICLNEPHFLLSFYSSHIHYSSHNKPYSKSPNNLNLLYCQLRDRKVDSFWGFPSWKRRDAL